MGCAVCMVSPPHTSATATRFPSGETLGAKGAVAVSNQAIGGRSGTRNCPRRPRFVVANTDVPSGEKAASRKEDCEEA